MEMVSLMMELTALLVTVTANCSPGNSLPVFYLRVPEIQADGDETAEHLFLYKTDLPVAFITWNRSPLEFASVKHWEYSARLAGINLNGLVLLFPDESLTEGRNSRREMVFKRTKRQINNALLVATHADLNGASAYANVASSYMRGYRQFYPMYSIMYG